MGARWLFFDMGSTLVDESACTRERARQLAAASGFTVEEITRRGADLARRGDPHAFSTLGRELGLSLAPWPMELERAYPEAPGVLAALHSRYRLGVIANQLPGSEERLRRYGLLDHLDLVVASAEAGVSKPDHGIFLLALRNAGCGAEDAVMIGDRLDNDILPAKSVGMRTCWVRQGLGGMSEAPADIADWVVGGISEVAEIEF